MTATILSFPTMFDRDQSEFDQCGASHYTRTFDEADALVGAVAAGTSAAALAPRIDALAAAIERLGRYRPEALAQFVTLAGNLRFALGCVPELLRAWPEPMTAHRQNAHIREVLGEAFKGS